MSDTDMQAIEKLALDQLSSREGGSIVVDTGPNFRLDLARGLSVHPQQADKLHSVFVRGVDQGRIEKTLIAPKEAEGVCVTQVKYTFVY